jgi:RNA recognition motif-containing protein
MRARRWELALSSWLPSLPHGSEELTASPRFAPSPWSPPSIVSVHLPKDRISQTHQGFGFCEFATEEDAEYACRIMNQIKLFGKPIRVNKVSLLYAPCIDGDGSDELSRPSIPRRARTRSRSRSAPTCLSAHSTPESRSACCTRPSRPLASSASQQRSVARRC